MTGALSVLCAYRAAAASAQARHFRISDFGSCASAAVDIVHPTRTMDSLGILRSSPMQAFAGMAKLALPDPTMPSLVTRVIVPMPGFGTVGSSASEGRDRKQVG